jgi:integrase
MTAKNSTPKPIATELQLNKLKYSAKTFDIKVANSPGLYVRVGKQSKSFRWDRGRGQTPRHITYGQFPAITLKQARDLHSKARESHSAGLIEEVDADTPKTVAELAEVFYSDRIVPKRRRPEIVRQVLDHDILPAIGNLPLSTVNTLAVRRTVKTMVDRGAKSHAARCLAILKQLFKFGVSISVMDSNPADSLEKDDLGAGDNVRNRVLDGDEIRLLWAVLDAHTHLSMQVRVGLQLLVLLGIRSGELRQAKWSDIDAEEYILTVPIDHQKLNPKQLKKAKPFIVPLDVFALSLFDQLRGINDVWIFPSRAGDAPITEKVFSKAVRRLRDTHLDDIEAFTPHDLRRTMRTNLSKLKIPPHVAELCLNHSLGSIIDVYDQHSYLDERREALEKWSQQVQVILGKHGDNVVRLEASA